MNRLGTILAFILMLLAQQILAKKTEEPACNACDWSCHGSFYVTAGGVYSHIYYRHNNLTFSPPNQGSIAFTPSLHFPPNLGGIRVGFGNGFDKKLPFAYEFDYNETFYKTQKNDEILTGISTKAFIGILSLALNPQSRLKACVLGGAAILSVYLTTETVEPRPFFSVTSNSVDIDPFVGGALIYQLNSKFALRVVEFYDISNYNKNLSGRLVTLFMLNYYPI